MAAVLFFRSMIKSKYSRMDWRFAVAGSGVMFAGMLVIGSWVIGEIEKGVTNNSAISAAMYMESFIAPMSQELANGKNLEPETRLRLDKLFSESPLSERIASVKIWLPGGLIAYASNNELIGKRFEPTEQLRNAWRGQLTAAFDELEDAEDAVEAKSGLPLLEVYNPIHSIFDGRIIAIAEFYQRAEELEQNLSDARMNSWLIVASVALATFALLFGIVRNGARLIDRQHQELQSRLEELDKISRQNIALRRRIQLASSRSSEVQERFLRRISAELHDGPAQALALASLRFGSIFESRRNSENASQKNADEVALIRQALNQALGDIRNLCSGMTLPEIEGKSLAEVLRTAIGAHERLTGTTVTLVPPDACTASHRPDHSTLICVYRFVQEGLMNAFRHADSQGQTVECALQNGKLELTVLDRGPGFDLPAQQASFAGIGLQGLRERIESIGGEFEIQTAIGKGSRLTMLLPIGE